MYYCFAQNNSGGFFIGALTVWVKADSEEEALRLVKTSESSWYEDDGADCSCCGSRWGDYSMEYSNADEIRKVIYSRVPFIDPERRVYLADVITDKGAVKCETLDKVMEVLGFTE